jgi:uncharacterized membrane protein
MFGNVEEDLDRENPPNFGQRCAEAVAKLVGSWKFFAFQTSLLVLWVIANETGWVHFDPFPYILLNLVLSLQAAYTAPMILMAQNRQNEKDRRALYGDWEVDIDTHEHIKQLETKIDLLLSRTKPNGE